jgi:molybdopterin converting factor small subunit
MGVRILIPTALRAYTDSQASVDIQGHNVGELLVNLVEHYTELQPHLFDESGRLRSFVNVYVNDEDFRYLEREDTSVTPEDVVSIVPAIAGGTP